MFLNDLYIDDKKLSTTKAKNPQCHLALWFKPIWKSTLADALAEKLNSLGFHTTRLDGDVLREGLCKDLGFSATDRAENLRRATEVTALMRNAGLIVIASFITPYSKERARIRERISTNPDGTKNSDFFEIFIDTPLTICEQRDTRGMYKLARQGKIKNFTGIDDPFEYPSDSDLTIKTPEESVKDSVQKIIEIFGLK